MYHKTTITALENRLADLQAEVDFTRAENVALQTAAQTNEATIKKFGSQVCSTGSTDGSPYTKQSTTELGERRVHEHIQETQSH